MDSIQTKEVWGWEKKCVFFKADWHSLNMSKTQTKFRLDCILSAEPYMFKCLRSYKFFFVVRSWVIQISHRWQICKQYRMPSIDWRSL